MPYAATCDYAGAHAYRVACVLCESRTSDLLASIEAKQQTEAAALAAFKPTLPNDPNGDLAPAAAGT